MGFESINIPSSICLHDDQCLDNVTCSVWFGKCNSQCSGNVNMLIKLSICSADCSSVVVFETHDLESHSEDLRSSQRSVNTVAFHTCMFLMNLTKNHTVPTQSVILRC